MKTVTIEVFAVDMSKAVGFRKMEPTGPAGLRFDLYLPSKGEPLITFDQLMGIVETHIVNSPLFPWKISYIHINPGDYNEDSSILLAQYLQEFPLTEDCRISCPASLIFGDGL
ncbi:hypothetical protein CB7_223 [Pectobacterium phage vB_PatM_CB7]|nr:hypothetical protein CB7_223 [Pectobacterium phage vB_PatM_CB7]